MSIDTPLMSTPQPHENTSEDALMSDAPSLAINAHSDAVADVTEQDVRTAALSVPDVDSGSQVALRTQGDSDGAALVAPPSSIDWGAVLGVSAQGLDAASTATSFGFQAARTATSLSLQLAKVITQSVVALPAMALDGAITGSHPWSNDQSGTPTALQLTQSTVGGLFDAISFLALGGIDVGSALTSAGLGAAGAGVEGVRRAVGSEVLRSLSAFAALVKREWNTTDSDDLPPGGIPSYSALGVTRALTAWVLIQLVTRLEYEKRMLRGLDEIDTAQLRLECDALGDKMMAERSMQQEASARALAPRVSDADIRQQPSKSSRSREVHITSEQTLPESEGDLIGATIGLRLDDDDSESNSATDVPDRTHKPLTTPEAMLGLRRYSRLVLGVYGGVALAWLGALPEGDDPIDSALGKAMDENDGNVVDGQAPTVHQPTAVVPEIEQTLQSDEEAFLAAASMRDEPHSGTTSSTPDGDVMPGAFGQANLVASIPTPNQAPGPSIGAGNASASTSAATATPSAPERSSSAYSYLDLITGKHDDDLFHRTARIKKGTAQAGTYDEHGPPRPADPSAPARPSRPRYYVVTDHDSRVVSLVIRGTLSVGDLAADLTCESVPFLHEFDDAPARGSADASGAGVRFPTHGVHIERDDEDMNEPGASRAQDLVHEGMYITAQEIGLAGRPVHRAVRQALLLHSTYALEIAGHSLGAGIASLLAMMWSSSRTGRTTESSGLPAGRPVRAYAFAVPCIATQALAKRYAATVTSFVSGYDLVPRLSLGSVLDIRNACAWLCYEEAQARAAARPASSDPSILQPTPFSLNRLTQRAFQHQAGTLSEEDTKDVELDLLVLRKTLEANMHSVHLFPPGLVHYAFEPNVFRTPTQAPSSAVEQAATADRLRLFRVKDDADLSDIFGQIVFYPSMISGHMPHVYSQQIHSLSGTKS